MRVYSQIRVFGQMRVYCIWPNACKRPNACKFFLAKCVSYIVIYKTTNYKTTKLLNYYIGFLYYIGHAFGQVKNVAYRPVLAFEVIRITFPSTRPVVDHSSPVECYSIIRNVGEIVMIFSVQRGSG